jgi:hypothetical protein
LRFVLFLLFFFFLPFANQSLGQNPNDDQIKSFADNCLNVIQSGNFEEAAELFHYPPNYSPKDLSEDKRGVKLGLLELSNIFGTFGAIEIVQRHANIYVFAVGGGNIEYWENYPQSIEIKYRTIFSKEGEGFLIFRVVRISEKLKLRSLAFGISAASPQAKERMQNIGRHMIEFMNQSMQPGR